MPFPIIPADPFPDVPSFPGVPLLARSAIILDREIVSLIPQPAQDPLPQPPKTAPVWGVFTTDGTKQVITPDSVYDFDYRGEYRISDYPTQQGGFATYNKVYQPFETYVRLTKGKTTADRQQFLKDCEAVLASLDLYTIITPERSYLGCNCTRMEVSRKGVQGAFFVEVDLYFRQVLQVTPQYSTTAAATQNAQVPAAQPVTNLGAVQPAAIPSDVNNMLGDTVFATVGPRT